MLLAGASVPVEITPEVSSMDGAADASELPVSAVPELVVVSDVVCDASVVAGASLEGVRSPELDGSASVGNGSEEISAAGVEVPASVVPRLEVSEFGTSAFAELVVEVSVTATGSGELIVMLCTVVFTILFTLSSP